jgi:hypothetical protein
LTLVYFTDRDLGKIFPAVLSQAGLTVERHHDHFAPDCPDEEWLAAVGSPGWVAITHDTRIPLDTYQNASRPPAAGRLPPLAPRATGSGGFLISLGPWDLSWPTAVAALAASTREFRGP